MSKFSEELCASLYNLSLDGGADDEAGDASYSGWYGLMTDVKLSDILGVETDDGFRMGPSDKVKHLFKIEKGHDGRIHAVLYNDAQGFVDCTYYVSAKKAKAEFDRVAEEIEADERGEGLEEDENERGQVRGIPNLHSARIPEDALRYIRSIRNPDKKRYAEEYAVALWGEGEDAANLVQRSGRVAYMAAQAVRIRLHQLHRGAGLGGRSRKSGGNRCRASNGQFARCR